MARTVVRAATARPHLLLLHSVDTRNYKVENPPHRSRLVFASLLSAIVCLPPPVSRVGATFHPPSVYIAFGPVSPGTSCSSACPLTRGYSLRGSARIPPR